jgi:hypothetical protein
MTLLFKKYREELKEFSEECKVVLETAAEDYIDEDMEDYLDNVLASFQREVLRISVSCL